MFFAGEYDKVTCACADCLPVNKYGLLRSIVLLFIPHKQSAPRHWCSKPQNKRFFSRVKFSFVSYCRFKLIFAERNIDRL